MCEVNLSLRFTFSVFNLIEMGKTLEPGNFLCYFFSQKTDKMINLAENLCENMRCLDMICSKLINF